jgi:hypothetical protein
MGAPNTQTILSPGEPSPLARTNALARSTIASASCKGSMDWGTTPQ